MERVLRNLLTLTGCSERDGALLQAYAPQVRGWTDEIVRSLADQLEAYAHADPRFRPLFLARGREGMEEMLRRGYLLLVEGPRTAQFWRRQWLYSLLHVQRGIPPALIQGMISRLQALFLERCLEELPPEEGSALFLAFKRITDVTAGLFLQAYLRHAPAAMVLDRRPTGLVLWERRSASVSSEEAERPQA